MTTFTPARGQFLSWEKWLWAEVLGFRSLTSTVFCCRLKVHSGLAPLSQTPLPQWGRFAFVGVRNSLSFLDLFFR
jgi:hypothetical protein